MLSLSAFLWLGFISSAQTPAAAPPPDPYEAASEKLKNKDPLVRRQGVEELGALRNANVIPTLTTALEDSHVFVRSAAAETLGLLRAPVAARLSELLDPNKEKEAAVRRSAATALAYLADPSSVDSLIAALRDPDPGVRYAAVRALGVLRSPKSTEALSGLLADPDVGMRRTVIAALGQIRDPAGADVFLRALKDPDVYVRLEAVKALGAIALPRTFEELRGGLKDKEAAVRLQTAAVLFSLGDPSGAGAALEALKEDKPVLRQQAADILAIAGDAKALAALNAALKAEKDPGAKSMMEAALARMKKRIAALKTPPPAAGAILLKKGDIEISGCMRSSRVRPGVCFWGHKERPGCAGRCGDAVPIEPIRMEFACSYRVSGTIADSASGKPREAFPVDLIFAGRARYRGRTKEDGGFSIEVPARKSSRGCREAKSFGRMLVEGDTPKVVLLGSLSPKFKTAHPKLKTVFKTADEIAGEGVDTAP